MSVGFITAAALFSEMMEDRDKRRPMRFQKHMVSYERLIIDELSFVPLSKTGAELLFELISQSYERRRPSQAAICPSMNGPKPSVPSD